MSRTLRDTEAMNAFISIDPDFKCLGYGSTRQVWWTPNDPDHVYKWCFPDYEYVPLLAMANVRELLLYEARDMCSYPLLPCRPCHIHPGMDVIIMPRLKKIQDNPWINRRPKELFHIKKPPIDGWQWGYHDGEVVLFDYASELYCTHDIKYCRKIYMMLNDWREKELDVERLWCEFDVDQRWLETAKIY